MAQLQVSRPFSHLHQQPSKLAFKSSQIRGRSCSQRLPQSLRAVDPSTASPQPTTALQPCETQTPLQPVEQSSNVAGAALRLSGLVVVAAACLSAAEAAYAAGDLLANSSPEGHAQHLYQVAEGGQEFWSNVARYGRYFVTVMLGTGYVMLRPLAGAFKNPVSAILAIAAIVGGGYFVKFTLEAMLGLANEPFEYVQGNF